MQDATAVHVRARSTASCPSSTRRDMAAISSVRDVLSSSIVRTKSSERSRGPRSAKAVQRHGPGLSCAQSTERLQIEVAPGGFCMQVEGVPSELPSSTSTMPTSNPEGLVQTGARRSPANRRSRFSASLKTGTTTESGPGPIRDAFADVSSAGTSFRRSICQRIVSRKLVCRVDLGSKPSSSRAG